MYCDCCCGERMLFCWPFCCPGADEDDGDDGEDTDDEDDEPGDRY